jgi:hypothetical protein
MTVPIDDFRQEFMGEWSFDRVSKDFCDDVQEYHRRCEEYDRTVCSRRANGIAMPANRHEQSLIQANARKVRGEILSRLCQRHPLTADQANKHWRNAQREWRHRPLTPAPERR